MSIAQQRPKVVEKRLSLANKLADKNDGKIPNPNKLILMGHGGLYRYMLRNPELFENFEVDKAVETDKKTKNTYNISIRKEHVKTAQKLAKRNGGKIPEVEWLQEHGHTSLLAYMRTYPHVFLNCMKGLTAKRKRV